MSEYPHILLRAEEKPLEHRSFSPRSYQDTQYEAAGARLVDTGVWPNAEPGTIVLGLKEIPEEDFPLKNDHITFAHCYKNQGGWEKVLGRWSRGGSTLYDLEFLHDAEGRRVSA
ncbi:saccharopine dehydrogenase (NAD+ L-lysine forming) [Fusarium tjaetaba]|uniref:Saccharopine dehydrogenase (NAD+ L-lysine forming) n=1 Tax=Fusarium tjaetaba TaxID=1567544 RepID=A0A8H5S641_9HYPO|nr:saccharopine dehydrogenase (NAD+ L-lysine forming) [Fusarium tjaetaba]KAF5646674.1 saccharopine dehydrogenase (NAD+ L-lysine forming) [Fusarium tjaetaba]